MEILEFTLAHRTVGFNAQDIYKKLIEAFEVEDTIQIEVSDNIIDLILKEIGQRFVTVTSIFIEND